jgi:hypothetical protein
MKGDVKYINLETLYIPILMSIKLSVNGVPTHWTFHNIKVIRHFDSGNRVFEILVPIRPRVEGRW